MTLLRPQPAGARLDEDGGRLWRWEGRGYIEEFYSVTTMISGGIPKHLQNWTAKMIAELVFDDVERHGAEVLDHWAREGRTFLDALRASGMKLEKADETPKGLGLRYIKGAADRVRDTAAKVGSDVHDAAETFVLEHAREGARLYALTGELPVWSADIAPRMQSFNRFLGDHRPIYLFTEARIYNRTRSYGGQADAFLRVKVPDDWELPFWITRPFVLEQDGGEAGWLTLCTDYKSGNSIYHEVAVQTAAYAGGEFIGAPDGVTELALPRIDSGAVLHLTPKGYRFRVVGPTDRAFRVFLFAREVFAWVQEQGRVGTRTWDGGDIPTDLEDALRASIEVA
jgi:hypothetical protein